ncbi:AEC family transporter [Aquimarina sp. RZ0]|uniref:AEC family transporter n=1 Tax=Aquimarina sp. RZ0 TaxID=2607730 RepID=UPI0011F3DCA9|nr:permease [Aquimarina sp. RZ0]KAA1244968.1 permease [Aquimarina sp. RZ0]
MDATIQKTILFGIFIVIGFFLKRKFNSKAEIQGLKKIILNLALPATIFIALMGIDIDPGLVGFPLMALGINLLLFYIFPLILLLVGFKKDSSDYRTMRLMIPSLAPGLSCFPFISEILGQEYLAKAAMADLGNKVFVLIILYSIATQWYFKQTSNNNNKKEKGKLKTLLITLFSEPVTLLILVALALMTFGFSFETLPAIAQDTIQKLSLLMTPLVMIFIGLAVKIRKDQCIKLLSILIIRAGVVMLISAGVIWVMQISVREDILWMLAFSLSACSFWPYAHIAGISEKEKKELGKEKTFKSSTAINLLALSFPLSTLIIMTVMLNPDFMMIPSHIVAVAVACLGIGSVLVIWIRLKEIKGMRSNSKAIRFKWMDYKKV